MGQAKELVQGVPTCQDAPAALELAGSLIDTLDRAIRAKQQDLTDEPNDFAANSWKLGILSAAISLVRRARAVLEDYATLPSPVLPEEPWLKPGIEIADDVHTWTVDNVERNDKGRVTKIELTTEHHGRNLTMDWANGSIDDFFAEFGEEDIV